MNGTVSSCKSHFSQLELAELQDAMKVARLHRHTGEIEASNGKLSRRLWLHSGSKKTSWIGLAAWLKKSEAQGSQGPGPPCQGHLPPA